MAGESETHKDPLEVEGSLIGEGSVKEMMVGELDSNLHIDGVCTQGSDTKLNDDVGLDGSIEGDKDVNPIGEGASGFEDSQVVSSLEGKSQKETAELDGNDATLDEQKSTSYREVSKILEKEVMSDVIQAESDVSQSIEGQDGAKIDSCKEREFGDRELNDAGQRKTTNRKVIKRATMKSSGKIYQPRYQLPREKEGQFSVCDMVWGKVKSHPWWPGQIFDPSNSSAQAMKHFKKDCYLVAYFWDGTFAWNEASKLKTFRTHFSHIEKQSNSEAFRSAVDCALDEVKRRVEFGLACSCIPKDTYHKIKLQNFENCGIKQELRLVHTVDESSNVSSFLPEKLVEYMKALSMVPTSSFDQLEISIAKAQLLAFYRLKGYNSLPELQYCGRLGNDPDIIVNDTDSTLSEVNEHTVHVSKNDDQSGTGNLKSTNRSRRKRKQSMKDGVYQEKKKIFSEPTDGTPESTHGGYKDDEVIGSLISPALSKKRKIVDHYADASGMKNRRKTISLADVSNKTKESFKIGERILRVASQLTSPPSMLNLECSGDRAQMADGNEDGFSGNGSDAISPNLEETKKSSLIFPTELSSLDDLLSLLKWVAEEPQGDYSFLNVIVSFFSDFRNSITVADDSGKEILPTKKIGTKRKKQSIGGSPETFDFDDLSDTCLADMVIQNHSKEQQSRRSSRLDYQDAPAEPEKNVHVYTRRSYSRKQYVDSNDAEVPEKPTGYIDEKSPAELVLNFAELDSIPSETSLNNIFTHFGPLKVSETEIDRGSSRARVVFQKCADAEVAFSSAKKFNVFGSILVNYQLNYSPSALFKASSFATTRDGEMHLDLSNVELSLI